MYARCLGFVYCLQANSISHWNDDVRVLYSSYYYRMFGSLEHWFVCMPEKINFLDVFFSSFFFYFLKQLSLVKTLYLALYLMLFRIYRTTHTYVGCFFFEAKLRFVPAVFFLLTETDPNTIISSEVMPNIETIIRFNATVAECNLFRCTWWTNCISRSFIWHVTFQRMMWIIIKQEFSVSIFVTALYNDNNSRRWLPNFWNYKRHSLNAYEKNYCAKSCRYFGLNIVTHFLDVFCIWSLKSPKMN